MFKVIHIKNFRRGLATNSSSTHSVIYKNKDDFFSDLNIFGVDYFDRHTENIAVTREAKIKYIFHAIWWNEDLVKIMSGFYPEMKEYYPLAKAAGDADDWNRFGMYSRGSMSNDDTLFSVDYLRHIIDSEDIVIVGGSDETDFVYDTIAGHDRAPIADDIYYADGTIAGKNNKPVKNGNYYVAFSDYVYVERKCRYASAGRLRFMTEDGNPTPEYPELIDLRITNRCNHGCDFCFMDSNMKQKDARIDELKAFIANLPKKTEFSIGGGNILLYPNLEELFKSLKNAGHIVNTTINVKDCITILSDERLKNLFKDYVDGIGVSVFSEDDVETFDDFSNAFNKAGESYERGTLKHIVMHIVPEYLGYEKTKAITRVPGYRHVLFLGYKETGRGANCKHEKFTEKQLNDIVENMRYCLAIDTQFARTYKDIIKKKFETDYTLTENEGEYSMYVDGVTMNAYKSSYETDKPYYIGHEFDKPWDKRIPWKDRITPKMAFASIRQDCGFPVYKEKHYWDEQ